MSKIKNLRDDIEKLHQDLLKMLSRRKDLVNEIWQLKQSQNQELTDPAREQALIHQFDLDPQLQQDENFKEFYQNVVKSIITENKKYLKKSTLK